MTKTVVLCDMKEGCANPVTHLDHKGYVYCAECAEDRRDTHRVRRLAPWELKRVLAGDPLFTYEPMSKKELAARIAQQPPSSAEILNWLQEQTVDTIYLDDGRIIDVKGGSVRDAISKAMKTHCEDCENLRQVCSCGESLNRGCECDFGVPVVDCHCVQKEVPA